MTTTEYKVGDLITDDGDEVIEGPVYKVHWFVGFENFADPISTETAEGIKIYRKLS